MLVTKTGLWADMVFASTVVAKLTYLIFHTGFANKSPIMSIRFLNEQGALLVAPYKALSQGRTLEVLVCHSVLMWSFSSTF